MTFCRAPDAIPHLPLHTRRPGRRRNVTAPRVAAKSSPLCLPAAAPSRCSLSRESREVVQERRSQAAWCLGDGERDEEEADNRVAPTGT